MANAVGDVVVALRADIGPFEQGMQAAAASMRTVEQRGSTMGRSLSGAAGNVIDLSGALSKANRNLSTTKTRINNVVGVTGRLANSAKKSASAFAQFDRARGQVDALRASYDPVFAASKRYEGAVEQLNNALALGVIKQQEYDASLERLGQSYLTAGGQAAGFKAQMHGAGGATANIAAQFNDIGVMLAAGQSPMQLALQQGTQLNQVFAQLGGGTAALKGVGAGLMSMINPMSLATIGIIAGGAALVQWGMKAVNAGVDTRTFEESLSSIQATMSDADRIMGILRLSSQELRDEFGLSAGVTRELAIAQAELFAAQASGRMAEALAVANDQLRDYVEIAGTAFQRGTMLRDAITNVARDFGIARDGAREVSIALHDLSNATSFEDQQTALIEIVRLIDEYNADLSDIPPELARAISEMITLQGETARAQELMRGLAAAAAGMTVGIQLQPGDGNLLPPSASPSASIGRGGGGGGGGGGRNYADEFEQLQTSLLSESERIQLEYETRLENLREFRAQRVATEEEFNAVESRLNQDHQGRLRDMELASRSARLGIVSGMMGSMATILENTGGRNLGIVRGFKIAEATITGLQAAVEAWHWGMSQPGGPATAALAASGSLLKTGALISQMASSGKGGSGAASAGAAATVAATQTPFVATIQGIDRDALYTGGQVDELLDKLMDAAGDRGLQLVTVAA